MLAEELDSRGVRAPVRCETSSIHPVKTYLGIEAVDMRRLQRVFSFFSEGTSQPHHTVSMTGAALCCPQSIHHRSSTTDYMSATQEGETGVMTEDRPEQQVCVRESVCRGHSHAKVNL